MDRRTEISWSNPTACESGGSKTALFVSGSRSMSAKTCRKGGFKVTNPNAVAQCSCGESFSAMTDYFLLFDLPRRPLI